MLLQKNLGVILNFINQRLQIVGYNLGHVVGQTKYDDPELKKAKKPNYEKMCGQRSLHLRLRPIWSPSGKQQEQVTAHEKQDLGGPFFFFL